MAASVDPLGAVSCNVYDAVAKKKRRKMGQRTFCLPRGVCDAIIASRPRNPRASQGGYCYHALNRGNGRRTVFHKDGDFAAFVKLLREAGERTPVRLLAWCLMPNHFHLALWPRADGELSDYMMWLLTAHVRRYHRHYHGSGHVYQGRWNPGQVPEMLVRVDDGEHVPSGSAARTGPAASAAAVLRTSGA